MSRFYDSEEHWDKVAESISQRQDMLFIAGDNEPYYQYKRKQFLKILATIDFANKKVLEVGSGPGGNLEFIASKNPEKLNGVDISSGMVELSKELLKGKGIDIFKIDGQHLPFAECFFDVVLTSTVLQHNTNEDQLKNLIKEICRVANSEVFLFERVEGTIKGHNSNIGRPVSFYEHLFREHEFHLERKKFLPIQCSYVICGVIRKLFNKSDRGEGEPLSKTSLYLEKIVLPFSSMIDKIIPSKRDLCFMNFKKDIFKN